MSKEYAGDNLEEIKQHLATEGYTEVFEMRENGFDLYRPFGNLPSHECSHVVVWPREDGGYWMEEY